MSQNKLKEIALICQFYYCKPELQEKVTSYPDLLCAEIAVFFLEIVILLTTLLLLLIALLANMAVSFISRYLINFSGEYHLQGRVVSN